MFSQPNHPHEIFFRNGHVYLLNIYNVSSKIKAVNEYRYICFTKAVVKKKAVNLATLPSTADATKYHFSSVRCV